MHQKEVRIHMAANQIIVRHLQAVELQPLRQLYENQKKITSMKRLRVHEDFLLAHLHRLRKYHHEQMKKLPKSIKNCYLKLIK